MYNLYYMTYDQYVLLVTRIMNLNSCCLMDCYLIPNEFVFVDCRQSSESSLLIYFTVTLPFKDWITLPYHSILYLLMEKCHDLDPNQTKHASMISLFRQRSTKGSMSDWISLF